MYVPRHFAQDDPDTLRAAMRDIKLATLVTFGTDGLEASHIPMIVEAEPGPLGKLRGHIARANPQWRMLKAEIPAMAMFLGPNAYISPSNYPTKQRTGEVVPTWNYVAIHVYGTLTVFHEPEKLLALVTELTTIHESPRPTPWAVADAPKPYLDMMLRGIVGLEMTITRLEGKWKMSQNQPAENRIGVAEGLAGEAETAEVARIVAETDKT